MSGYPLLANRTGGYAVATASSRPWVKSSATSATSVAKPKRTKAPPAIVHQLFADWIPFVEDPYWQAIFTNASIGKFPRGFTFQDNILTYKRGNKLHKFPLQGPEAINVYADVIEFFGQTAGLRSVRDQERIQREQEEREAQLNSIENLKWGDIRRGRVKDILLTGFVEDVARSMQLDRQQKLQLRTVIGLGFILGYFGNDDVIMVNGKIQGITGIIYNGEAKQFDIDPNITPKKTSSSSSRTRKKTTFALTSNDDSSTEHGDHDGDSSSVLKEISFITLWNKYLTALEKKQSYPGAKLPEFQVIDRNAHGRQRTRMVVIGQHSDVTTGTSEPESWVGCRVTGGESDTPMEGSHGDLGYAPIFADESSSFNED